MNLLLPGFLAAAALIALPLFLHLLRLEPKKRVPFPTLRFLGREALRDSNRHRLTRWLLLLLRCLLVLLVAAAFARPFWPLAHTSASRAVIVVVDNSYSMQAKGRREAVEAWLAPQLDGLQPPDELGVLTLQPAPAWLVPLTRDLASARASLRPLPQGFETSHYGEGLELAAAVLAAAPTRRKQILLAGDEQRLGWDGVGFDRPLPPGVELLTAPVAPRPVRQAAIVSLKAERSDDGHLVLEAGVRGFSPDKDERTVTFYAGENVLGVQRCSVAALGTQTVRAVFAVPHLESALAIRATLDPDDLPVDDTAYAALAPTDDRSVMVAKAPSRAGVDYLTRALGAVKGVRGVPGFRLLPLPASGRWPVAAVAILRGAGPFRPSAVASLDAFIAEGGPAWILCNGLPEQTAWLARHGVTVVPEPVEDGGLNLRDLALDHPLFAPFVGQSLAPLLEPTFHRAWRLEGDIVEPLARWPDRGVAIAEVPTGAGRLLVTGFGGTRADSTFPVQVGYVPFVHQAALWLAKNTLTVPNRGEVGASLALPGAGTWTPIWGPRKAPPLEVEESVAPAAPGIYEFKGKGGSRFYAVNLDTVESDLAPWPTPADFGRLVSSRPAPGAESGAADRPVVRADSVDERDAWWWLLAAAIALLFFELALANRTVA